MKTIFLLLLAAYTFPCVAQINPKDYFMIFDKNWESTSKEDKADYFIHVMQLPDSSWEWDYYKFSGPMIKSEMYKDEAGKIPNGFFTYYNKKGFLDSCGYVFEMKKDRRWTYFKENMGKVYLTIDYDKGRLLKRVDYQEDEKKEKSKRSADSSNKTEVNVEVESEFVGGAGAWSRYLKSSMKYPDRAISLDVTGESWILFIVDTEGKVTEPLVARSVEYSIDQESLRIIKESPNWKPAFQNGRKVKSYKKQPIVYKFSYE